LFPDSSEWGLKEDRVSRCWYVSSLDNMEQTRFEIDAH
ncbi:hypothetical protein GE061_001999, partial [Apolygus lucorum]